MLLVVGTVLILMMKNAKFLGHLTPAACCEQQKTSQPQSIEQARSNENQTQGTPHNIHTLI